MIRHRKFPSRCLAVLSGMVATILLAGACGETRDRPRANLTVGTGPGTYVGLVFLAEALGAFSRNNLHVTLRDDFDPGFLTLDALCRGELDVGAATDFAVMGKLFEHGGLRILGSIALVRNVEIVARRDRAIATPADLRGKKIGVTMGAAGEYFLYTFLLTHHITMEEIIQVDIPPRKMPLALANGQIDAIITWERNVLACKERLGANAVAWDAQQSQYSYLVLMTTDEVISRQADALHRLLEALAEAARFVRSHEEQAKSILRARLRYDPAFFQTLWNGMRFELALDQSLLESMEDAARWKLKTSGREGSVPNYLDAVYHDALQAVDPRLITIYRQGRKP